MLNGPKFPEEGQLVVVAHFDYSGLLRRATIQRRRRQRIGFIPQYSFRFATSAATIVKSNPYTREYGLRNNQEICLVNQACDSKAIARATPVTAEPNPAAKDLNFAQSVFFHARQAPRTVRPAVNHLRDACL